MLRISWTVRISNNSCMKKINESSALYATRRKRQTLLRMSWWLGRSELEEAAGERQNVDGWRGQSWKKLLVNERSGGLKTLDIFGLRVV